MWKRSGGFERGILDLLEVMMASEIRATTASDTVVMIGIDIVVISKDGDSNIGTNEGLGFVISANRGVDQNVDESAP